MDGVALLAAEIDAAAMAGVPETPTSRMQSSSVGCLVTPTARQIISARERVLGERVAAVTRFLGNCGSVNRAEVSPGQ